MDDETLPKRDRRKNPVVDREVKQPYDYPASSSGSKAMVRENKFNLCEKLLADAEEMNRVQTLAIKEARRLLEELRAMGIRDAE